MAVAEAPAAQPKSKIFGDLFTGTRVPAWAKLGITFENAPTPTEAVKAAGLDYEVSKQPLYYGGDKHPIPGRFALVREQTADDPEEIFGFCGPKYEILQHRQVAELIDGLTDEWPISAAGALGEGETAFMVLDAGEAAVAGDPIRNYFLITNSATGGRAVRVAYTPVRVRSQGTLVTGLAAANLSSAIPHLQGVTGEVAFRVTLLRQMRKAQQATMAIFTKMAETKITELRAKQVVEAAFPTPTVPAKVRLLQQIKELENFDGDVTQLEKVQQVDAYRNERLEAFRQGAMEVYAQFNADNPQLSYTAWAIWNAVVEVADFRNGLRDESVATSSLFGPRCKEKVGAFRVASSLVK